MTTSKTRLAGPLIGLSLQVIACASEPVTQMRAVFAQDLQNAVGESLLNESNPNRVRDLIQERKPTEVKRFQNGNLLHVYKDYWGGAYAGAVTQICDVYIEFESETMRVINAYSNGEGCYRAY